MYFLTLDPGRDTLELSGLGIWYYPMGEPTVHGAFTPGRVQVAYVQGTNPDWTEIALWADLARRNDAEHIVLFIPFLPGARGDKDTPRPAAVNARLAAATGITRLVTVDPHSPVWLDEFDRACGGKIDHDVLDLGELVREAVGERLYRAVIAPDAGAQERAGDVARALGITTVYTAAKSRDPETGRLLSYEIDIPDGDGDLLVVDDLCDGGGTFLLLAEALGDRTADLWVSHAGFTKGTDLLLDRYRQVYTTDSLPRHPGLTTVALAPMFTNYLRTTLTERN